MQKMIYGWALWRWVVLGWLAILLLFIYSPIGTGFCLLYAVFLESVRKGRRLAFHVRYRTIYLLAPTAILLRRVLAGENTESGWSTGWWGLLAYCAAMVIIGGGEFLLVKAVRPRYQRICAAYLMIAPFGYLYLLGTLIGHR